MRNSADLRSLFAAAPLILLLLVGACGDSAGEVRHAGTPAATDTAMGVPWQFRGTVSVWNGEALPDVDVDVHSDDGTRTNDPDAWRRTVRTGPAGDFLVPDVPADVQSVALSLGLDGQGLVVPQATIVVRGRDHVDLRVPRAQMIAGSLELPLGVDRSTGSVADSLEMLATWVPASEVDPGASSTYMNFDGSFELHDVAVGVEVRVGIARADAMAMGVLCPAASARAGDADLELRAAAGLSLGGEVRGIAALGLQAERLDVFLWEGDPASEWLSLARTRLGKDHRFSFPGLHAGVYTVAVFKDHRIREATPRWDGLLGLGTAVVTVGEASDVLLDVSPDRGREQTVELYGEPSAEASAAVFAAGMEFMHVRSVSLDAAGVARLRFAVPAGATRWTVIAQDSTGRVGCVTGVTSALGSRGVEVHLASPHTLVAEVPYSYQCERYVLVSRGEMVLPPIPCTRSGQLSVPGLPAGAYVLKLVSRGLADAGASVDSWYPYGVWRAAGAPTHVLLPRPVASPTILVAPH